jgi:hypothetical protein
MSFGKGDEGSLFDSAFIEEPHERTRREDRERRERERREARTRAERAAPMQPLDELAADAVEELASEHRPASAERHAADNMLPRRERRRFGLERILVRMIATAGIVGIGVVVAAIMVSDKSQGWIVGLVVACLSVALSAVLWSSRQL